MKNMFHPEVNKEILARIDKMSPDLRERKWGKMNNHQAVRHMTMAFQIPLQEISPKKNGKAPKWLMRFFLLSVKPPKGRAETFAIMNMVANKVDPKDFEAERKNLKNYLQKFLKAEKLADENSMAGKFSRDDWGKLLYNHTDHHLRQFGV